MPNKTKRIKSVNDKIIYTSAMWLLMFLGSPLLPFAQGRRIHGRVTSATDHMPLSGASITLVGTARGTFSTPEGHFLIPAVAGDHLLISYAGYVSQTILVGSADTLNIDLVPSESNLNEVVVIGYGTQNRHDLSGAVATVNPLAFKTSPTTNIGTVLQGTVPGLQVQQTTGQPGSTPTITFRGGNNWSGTGGPLVVLDGVIVPSVYGINMDDVASINLLKDAASTAIYGARASNGVLLITTKKGLKGHAQVTYTIRQTDNYARKNPVQYLNAGQYIAMNWIGLESRYSADSLDGNTNAMATDRGQLAGSWGWALNSGWTSPQGLYTTQILNNSNRYLLSKAGWSYEVLRDPFTSGQMDSVLYHDINTQARENMIMQNETTTEHSLNFSGGNDMGNFNLGLGYVKDEGVIIGSGLKRINMNFNGGLNIGKLKITTTMSAYNVNTAVPYTDPGSNAGTTGGLLQRFVGVAPTVRYNNDTSGAILPGPNDVTLGNPAYWSKLYQNSSSEQRFMGSLNIDYTILPFLKFLASGSGFMRYDFNNYFTHSYQAGSGGSMNTTRAASFSDSHDVQYSYNASLQFDKTFNGVHHLTVMGGGEFYDYKYYYETGSGQSAPTNVIPWLVASAPPSVVNGVITNPQSASSDFSAWERLASAIGRINYSYKDKYYLTANMRYDGSSRLSPANHYGFFPGISFAWNMQNEAFFQNNGVAKVISTLKPRVSWGENGNVNSLSYFQTAQVYANAGTYNGQGGTYVSSYVNTNLKWEKSAATNLGLDLGFLKNRITIIVDYFIRNNYDQVASEPIDPSSGFSSFTTNLGEMRNKGWELSLNVKAIQPTKVDGLALDLNANLYSVRDYAVKLPYDGLPGNRQSWQYEVWDPKHPGQEIYVGGLQEGQRVNTDQVWAPKWDYVYTNSQQISADANVYNAYLPYANKKIKQLGDARWHQVYKNDTIDSRQFVYVGRTTPSLTGGFNANLSYKGFSLYASFDFAVGFVILNEEVLRGLSQVQGSQNQTTAVLNTWSLENPNGALPRFYWANQGRNYATDASGNNPPANMWEKGDYLALRELTLSYDMASRVLKESFNNKIKALRLFVSGGNLSYFTRYSGSLPEIGGLDQGRYPLPRRLTFGATVGL